MRPLAEFPIFNFRDLTKSLKKVVPFPKRVVPFPEKVPYTFVPKIETAFHFGGLEPLLKLIIDSGPSPW